MLTNDNPLDGIRKKRKPYAMVGAGKLTASIWKTENPRSGCNYRFNVFRLNSTNGRVSQQFTPSDVADLVKFARVLASTLADDGCLAPQQRKSLIDLAADIDQIISPSQ
jgi:hypothetical protein